MADQWLDPHLNALSTVIVAVLLVASVYAGLVAGPRAYRRLVEARELGRNDLVRRRYRQLLRLQAARVVAVLLVVALDAGVTRQDVGLVLPNGPHAAAAWGWTLYACVLLALATVVLRARVRRGRTVPGQRMFAALVARPGERGIGTALAVGAGVSEEMLFRGLFTAATVSLFGLDAWPACLVVSVLFGLLHAYQGWLGVLGTGVAGVLLSQLYLDARSLLPAMIVHAAVDLRGIVAVPVAEAAPVRHR